MEMNLRADLSTAETSTDIPPNFSERSTIISSEILFTRILGVPRSEAAFKFGCEFCKNSLSELSKFQLNDNRTKKHFLRDGNQHDGSGLLPCKRDELQ